jgi:alpha-2-macroglobulin
LRGTLDRQVRGIWNTTPANAWGILAVEKFAAAFEPAPPVGINSVTLNNKTQTQDWGKKPKGQTLSFPWPPQQSKLTISAAPQGKPWATVESRAAIPLDSPLSTGYKIEKTYAQMEPKSGGFKNGDLVRVHLKIEAQSDMGWVVVNDPIPAGSSILGTGLGRDSQLATQGERYQGWVWPTFEERSQEAFRAFYEYVPKGNWTVEYTLRLNQAGKFHLPPTRVEALYAPEMFGEIPNSDWEIK